MAESLLCSTLHQMFMIARLGPYVFLVGVCWSVTMMIVDNIDNRPNELFARHLMCGRCFFSHSVVTRGSFSPKSREKRTDDVTIPVDKSEEGVTIVGYYFCEEPIPYRTTLAGRRPTLGQFKHLLTKKGCWRLVKLLTRSFFFVKLANGKQYAVLLSKTFLKCM